MRWPLPDEYPHLYVEFLYLFNKKQDYYECHEVLEDLWLEEGRHPLYQGLLQVAVALHHFRNDNVNGAVKLFRSALAKLRPFPDDSLGIDLGKVKGDVQEYLAQLEQYDRQPVDFYDLTIAIHDAKLKELVDEVAIGERRTAD